MGFPAFCMMDTRTDDGRLGERAQPSTLKIQRIGCVQKPRARDGARQGLRQKRSMDLLWCRKEIQIMFAKQPKTCPRRHDYQMLLIE